MLALLASAPMGGAALAQQTEFAPPSAAEHRVGPFAVSPAVALHDLGVDSNVYNNVDNQRSDFTFTVRPSIDARARVSRAFLTFRSATELVYFAQQTSERSVNQDLGVGARVPLRRLTFTTGTSYLNTRQRPTEEIDLRSRRVDRNSYVGANVGVTPKVSLALTGRYFTTRFDGDAMFEGTWLARELNRDLTLVSGAVRYAVTPLTAVSLTVDSGRYRFVEDAIRDADSRVAMFGIELNPRALISGNASIGVQRFLTLRPDVPDFSGAVGSAGLFYRLAGATRIGVDYERNVNYSYSETEPFYLRTGFGFSLRRQIVDRWDIEASAHRFRHRYENLVVESERARREQLLDTSVGHGYQARPGVRFVTTLSRHSRTSDRLAQREYSTLRLGTSVVYGF